MSLGNFAYGGIQRSYSFPFFWADLIPTSTTGAQCPDMPCEQVFLQNDPDSSGNIVIGDLERLQTTGHGFCAGTGRCYGLDSSTKS